MCADASPPRPCLTRSVLTLALSLRRAMSNLDNLRILGFGNPLLDISAVVEQDVLDK
jgi:hypothetical protein